MATRKKYDIGCDTHLLIEGKKAAVCASITPPPDGSRFFYIDVKLPSRTFLAKINKLIKNHMPSSARKDVAKYPKIGLRFPNNSTISFRGIPTELEKGKRGVVTVECYVGSRVFLERATTSSA